MPSDLLTRVASEVASEQALIPVVWLGWLHLKKRDPGLAWWWLSGVFLISWLADTAALLFDPWVMSKVYPLSQAALVGLVFLSRREATQLIIALMFVGIADVLWIGVGDFDVLLRTVAWGAVVGIVYPLRQLGRLRLSLLVAFGLGWFCWMLYALSPGWTTWVAYQLTRFLGVLLFCWAATSPLPQLKLSRSH